MRIPLRKPITYMTTEAQLNKALEPSFGKEENGSYFIGCAVGPGWNDIVLDLHMKLLKESPEYAIIQVKEKFGGLRYYVSGMTERGRKYIENAEKLSYKTCEECGRSGSLREDMSWIRTLCDYDYKVSKINAQLWVLERRVLGFFFGRYFYINRMVRKARKEREKKITYSFLNS